MVGVHVSRSSDRLRADDAQPLGRCRAAFRFLGRKFEYEPKNQFEETYAHYPTEIVEKVRNQVSMSALKALIVHMGSLKEGRKSLILVSEGYTEHHPAADAERRRAAAGLGNPAAGNPFAGANDINEDRATWSGRPRHGLDLREIYDTANRNNVAIYAVDPRGLPGFEFDINENIGFQTDSKYLTRRWTRCGTLAENTDGRAIVNRNDIAAGMKQITPRLERVLPDRLQLGAGAHRRQISRDQGEGEAPPACRSAPVKGTGRSTAKRLRVPPPRPGAGAEAGRSRNHQRCRPPLAGERDALVGRHVRRLRTARRASRSSGEPLPKSPGDRPREEPARVSLMAIAPDGSAVVPWQGPGRSDRVCRSGRSRSGTSAARGPSRVSFECRRERSSCAFPWKAPHRRCSTARPARSACRI
jgi:hypothetical protein